MQRLALHTGDWIVIGLYLAFALAVGLKVREKAESDRESYFLAGRSLPWWWAGLSIAATTFAADTPLAVTGIVADRGLSGNWMWLSWIGVHAAVVVYFAARWSRSGVLTDAELIEVRYSGRSASLLRWVRAMLFGVVYNCIILGWVLRAMVKIVTPFFHWDVWLPGAVAALATIWPEGSPLGTPSEGMTIIALLGVVGFYSSLGGIRGVIFTDLIQLGVAMIGSIWLATAAWWKVGGTTALVQKLGSLYGGDHVYLDLFPSFESGWVHTLGIGAFTFGTYLLVQSYANIPADGGGYLMQRLNSTKSPKDARRASMLFVLLQYVIRSFPWFVVAVCALVLIPIGQEHAALGGAAAQVAGDRELAYPVLMADLLPPVVLGLMVTSLLAAFMSTVDTHINWGASYMVNDVFLALRPWASDKAQLRVARSAVIGFALLAVFVSLHIDTIEQAWRWVAALGAALGVPTVLRWLWWRVNAAGEILAMIFGLGTAAVLLLGTDVAYEVRLVAISGASVVGLLAGVLVGPKTAAHKIEGFIQKVQPLGFWPGRAPKQATRQLLQVGFTWCALVIGVVAMLTAAHRLLFMSRTGAAFGLGAAGIALFWLAGRMSDEAV